MIAASLSASDQAPLQRFLTLLWRTDPPKGSVVTVWDKDSRKSYHYESIRAAELKLKMLTARHDVYVGVCARRPNLDRSRRGGVDDVVAVPAFFADIDVGDKGNGKTYVPSIKAALDVLDQFPVVPSLVIMSGTGLHVYWLFERPVTVHDARARSEVRTQLKAWGEYLTSHWKSHGFDIDPVFDLSRVLRAPGCVHHKASRNNVRVLTKFLRVDELRRYESPESLLDQVPSVSTIQHHSTELSNSRTDGISDERVSEILARPGVKKYLSGSRMGKTSISEGDAGLIAICRTEGMNAEQIGEALDARRRASGEKLQKVGDRQYQAHSIKNVDRWLSENGRDSPTLRTSQFITSQETTRMRAIETAVQHVQGMKLVRASGRLLLIQLAWFVKDDDVVSVAQLEMARRLGVSERTICNCLKEVVAEGCIKVIDPLTGPGKVQRLRLNFLSADHRHGER